MPQAFQGWYKHDIDAWRGSAAVQDMTDAEYRAYHNLLMAQFESEDGMLPDDEKELAKLSRKRAEWQNIREVVLEQFERGGEGRVYNARMHYEWQQAKSLSEQRAKGAKSTNDKRWKKGDASPSDKAKHAQRPDSDQSATAQRSVNTERNGTLRDEEQEHSARPAQERPRREPTEAELDHVRLAYPRKTAPPEARRAIRKAVLHLHTGKDIPAMTTSEALQFLHGRAVLFAQSPAGQQGDFTPHSATWFNQGRYLDHESEWQRSGDGGRANGTDRQRFNSNGGGSGSPAEQRVADSRSRIAKAFGRAGGVGHDGGVGRADGGELLTPDSSRWPGRIVDAAVVGHSAQA